MNIFLIIILFSLLILGHELGHFLAAKKVGAKVEEFGFGFPPRIAGVWKDSDTGKWNIKWGTDEKEDDTEDDEESSESELEKDSEREATMYSINLLPIGGFVKIFGEEGGHRDDPRSFAARSPGERTFMLTAGVGMNIVLAVIFFSIVSFLGSPQVVQDKVFWGGKLSEERVQILQVLSDSPADKAGVKMGDTIEKIGADGKTRKVDAVTDVQNFSDSHRGEKLTLTLKREGKVIEKTVLARKDAPKKEGEMGIALAKTAMVNYPWYVAPLKGLVQTAQTGWTMLVVFGKFLKTLIVEGEMMGELAGPVGVVNLSRQAAKLGINYLLNFGAIISINLAIINILPFPALDGGRLLFVGIEKLKGDPVSDKLEARVHQIGFALLILLLIFVTFRDVQRLL